LLPKALKGCIYTAHEQGLRDINACGSGVAYNFASGFFAFGLGFFSAYGTKAADDSRRQSCIDMAVMQSKATGYDCPQPGCPGFDAHAKGGACEFCKSSCCPDQSVDTGYSCCTLGCACEAIPAHATRRLLPADQLSPLADRGFVG
jgi:hypothetical protein